MESLLLSKNWKYWVYTLLGWIVFHWFTLSFPKLAYAGDFETMELVRQHNIYMLLEGVACGILCYLLSFVILYYLEKKWNWAKFEKSIIQRLVIIFILVQIAYSLLIWPLLGLIRSVIYDSDYDLSPITTVKMVGNMPYFATRFLIWFFIIFVYYGYRYLKNTKMRELELETNLNKSRLNTLKGQINPHFMFNSLNNIRGLMLEDVNKSRSMLTKLSEMLRFSLNTDDVHFISLEKELELVDNFIALAKIQYEDRLDYAIDLNGVHLQTMVPPMIIQLLVENAVKHGISKIKKGGIVKVTLADKDNGLLIKVRNSGKLSIGSDSTQVGLENIKKRLQLLYEKEASFSLAEDQNEVLATIKLPRS